VLDLKAIRDDPGPVRAALARRRDGSDARLDRVLELDVRRRELIPEVEGLKARQNAASQAIAAAKKAGEDAADAIAAMQEVARRGRALREELDGVQADLQAVLGSLPNPPDPSAPDEDTVLREVGESGRTGRDHLELAGAMIDMEAGAKVAGSRFAFLKGDLVFVELALVRWVLELLRGKGFEPVVPPVLVREEALYGTGFLPDTEQQIYRLADDPLYLTGTSEVPLASLHAGEILDAGRLPRRYAGLSPCFRREAGAAGRDSRGIFRVHQFDKVEMFAFVAPEDAVEEHERLLAIEEEILQALGVPYRVVNIAVDELGSSAAKKYDLEAWLPGQARFRELTSTSNTTDFQSRRLDIRYRPDGGGPRHVATLNGTAVAVGRTLIALLENGQREDGGVAVPEVLHAWGAPAELRVGEPG
jgi:seryl-tRNA synthetase